MGQHWDQIKSYSGLTAIVSLYGIAALLVVFLGPSMGFGLTEQVIIIALLLLTWPIAILIMHFRRRRRERREARESAAAESATGELASGGGRGLQPSSRSGSRSAAARVPSRVYSELARGVEEVVQWLRSTKLSTIRRKDPVYSLPWFLVAGAPGSGKTSLLLSSGLDFHALPSQRRSDQNLIRPTRDVEWRVTDWCVLLDSTGRYQTEGPDGDEWSALIETIIKYRKRRPIDGLVITADAGALLGSTDAAIEQQAKILRSRLDQVNRQVQARFPVYLVFTHADSIEGFGEFFQMPDAAERGQVWGATIPLEHSASAHALFDVEFDALYDTLMRYRLLRLSAQESAGEQLVVFEFPLRFAEARRRLGLFTSALFRPNPFSESPLLRGFYFTSSASPNGSDRVGRAPAEDAIETVAVAGEGCFTERLFNDVLLRDRDLAASFQRGKTNPARLQNALLAAAAAVVLFFIGGLIASVANNLSLIDEARRTGSRVASYSKDIQAREAPADYASTHAQLQDIDRLREMLLRLDEYDRDWPPFYFNSLLHRFGLYSGRSVSPYLRAIYFDSINQQFFKPTIAALETDLNAFRPEAPPPSGAADSAAGAAATLSSAEAAEERLGQYYDLLKVYLMVSRYPERAVPSLVIERLGDHWKKSAAPEDEALALNQLVFFANSLPFEDAPHITAKDETVRAACVKLESFPAMSRYYKRAIDEISSTTNEVAINEIVGARKGIVEGTARVKGAFTSEGFKKMLTAIKEAETGMSEEDWVCPNAPTSNDQRDINKVKAQYARQYSRQYIDAWRKFLKDAKVAEYTTDGAAKSLDELSKNDSPLERVLSEVAKQTNLYRPGSFWARINPFSANKSETGSTIAKAIEGDFQTVIKFVSGEGGIGPYRQVLTDVRNVLNEDASAEWSQLAKRLLLASDPRSLAKFEAQQKPLIQSVKGDTGAGVDATSLLEQPLANLRKLLLASNLDQIEREWRDKLQPAAQRLEQGYPFAVGSAPDAPLTDVARFFNPADGQLWSFYKLNLEPYFTEADGQFKLKEGSKIKLSDSFINYLNKARRLSDALFPQNGKNPGFTFGLTLQPSQSGNASVEIQVEGKRIDASAPPLNIGWSGSSGAAITVFQGSGQPQSKQYSGWWALFRMFEEGGGASARTGDNQYALAWKVQGTTVRAKLQPPGTTNNPFDLRLFKDLRTPQSTQ